MTDWNYYHRIYRQILYAVYFTSIVMFVAGCDPFAVFVTDVIVSVAIFAPLLVVYFILWRRHRRRR